MIRGLYVSAAAMLSHGIRHAVNSANIANLDTPGYKARRVVLGEFQRLFVQHLTAGAAATIGTAGVGPAVVQIVNDVSQGPLRETGRKLDVALQGPGFFVVATPLGLRYTRAGDFRLDDRGRLVTAEGFPVLGEDGEITLGTVNPDQLSLTSDGRLWVEGQEVDRLRIVSFPAPEHLERSLSGTFAASTAAGLPVPATGTTVLQGFLEEANVSPVAAAVEMLDSFRAYEASQQAVRVQSETLRLAANELGRL